jgi:uncharacterized protein (DUF433 family)
MVTEMAYATAMTSLLSGASMGQLSYWRRTGVLKPELSGQRPIAYSFRDLVALRTCVYLREAFSLQKIRKAVHNLRALGEIDHLAQYRILANSNLHTIAFVLPDQEAAVDLLRRPGQHVMIMMSDVLRPFENAKGQLVPDLRRPSDGISIDPRIKGGHPVVEGTRVSFELVASLVADGVRPDRVKDYYPTVSTHAALQAASFADQINTRLASVS